MKTKTVAIIGVGLIGGSLGLALRRAGGYRVIGIGRHPAKLRTALRRKAVDAVTVDMATGVHDADIVVICAPVDTIAPLTAAVLPHCKAGAIITDAGSVKGTVLRDVAQVFTAAKRRGRVPVSFVGAHPMAGLEKNGIGAAAAQLYRDATVVLAGTINAAPRQIDDVAHMWRHAGGRVCRMSPAEHDTVVALTSHLPHAIAFSFSALAGALMRAHPAAKQVTAGSFKDMTRIAASNPRDWACICRDNGPAVARALDDLVRVLSSVKKNLGSQTRLEQQFVKGHRARRGFV